MSLYFLSLLEFPEELLVIRGPILRLGEQQRDAGPQRTAPALPPAAGRAGAVGRMGPGKARGAVT